MTSSNLKPYQLGSNSKLAPDHIAYFNLPAKRCCPGAGACLDWCMCDTRRIANSTKTSFFRFSPAKIRADYNLELTKRFDFVELMVESLRKSKVKVFRWHCSGDFYSQSYLNDVFEIARSLPKIRFYAYSKSLHLDWSKQPANFRLIQSLGGKYDNLVDLDKPIAKCFTNLQSLTDDGYTYCGDSDLTVFTTNRVGLVFH